MEPCKNLYEKCNLGVFGRKMDGWHFLNSRLQVRIMSATKVSYTFVGITGSQLSTSAGIDSIVSCFFRSLVQCYENTNETFWKTLERCTIDCKHFGSLLKFFSCGIRISLIKYQRHSSNINKNNLLSSFVLNVTVCRNSDIYKCLLSIANNFDHHCQVAKQFSTKICKAIVIHKVGAIIIAFNIPNSNVLVIFNRHREATM